MTPERWQQVKELFQAALELDASQRAAFLDQACAGEPSLRKQVEALIASHEGAPSFLEEPAVEVAAQMMAEDQAESVVGQRIGSYKILSEISHGGMGVVYLATRADDEYRKQVAIKLVKRGMDTDAILRRFRHERQILATLDHSNIAKLLDGGTTEDGLPYFVMDYVDGLPIDVYSDRQKLSVVERLRLFRTVCSAVHYAHQRQVIHRDLKPSNILVTGEGVPKLLDFGIAKVLDPELYAQTVESTMMVRPMTPEYASPEQVRGETVTPASDVYSLGVLLYELLTGHQPYRLKGRSLQEIERAICEQEPEKPSLAISRVEEVHRPEGPMMLTPESVSQTREGEPEKLRRQLAGDIDAIVLKALRKEPDKRYASVEAFSEDIGRHLEGRPVMARKGTVRYRAAKFMKRNKASVMVAAFLAVALIMLVVVGFYVLPRQDTRTRKEIDSLAVLPLENLSGDPEQDYFADGMTEALITNLAKIRALRVVSRTTAMYHKGTKKPLPEIARELNVDALVEGSVVKSGERLRANVQLVYAATDQYLWAGTYERDLRDTLSLGSEIAQTIAQEIGIKVTPGEQARLTSARPVHRQAFDEYLRGRYYWSKRTREDLKKAIRHYQNALDEDPAFAPAYAGMADCYNQLGTVFIGQPPAEMRALAAAAAKRALEIDNDLAEAQASLAYANLYQWNWAGAEQGFKRAIELSPSYASAHLWYAHYLTARGRFEEALAEVKLAETLDPLSPIIKTQVGWLLGFARRDDEAIEQYQKVLEMDPNFVWALWQLGIAYTEKGLFDQAIATLEKAVTLSGRNPTMLAWLGNAYVKSGRRAEAQELLNELTELSKQRYISPFSLVLLHFNLGNKDQAFAWLEKAYQERSNGMAYLNVDRGFDPLRSDPRFQDLLRRVGLK